MQAFGFPRAFLAHIAVAWAASCSCPKLSQATAGPGCKLQLGMAFKVLQELLAQSLAKTNAQPLGKQDWRRGGACVLAVQSGRLSCPQHLPGPTILPAHAHHIPQ